jgi:hypothetical protein
MNVEVMPSLSTDFSENLKERNEPKNGRGERQRNKG